MACHFAALPASAREVREALAGARAAGEDGRPSWTMPLIVLGACTVGARERKRQRALSALSTRGRYEEVSGCGHWAHLDAPERVLATILGVVREARDGAQRDR